jgi:hypothetical protein
VLTAWGEVCHPEEIEDTLVWMHDEADDADTTHFLEKLSGLECVSVMIIF